jgi:hypothetical protein
MRKINEGRKYNLQKFNNYRSVKWFEVTLVAGTGRRKAIAIIFIPEGIARIYSIVNIIRDVISDVLWVGLHTQVKNKTSFVV